MATMTRRRPRVRDHVHVGLRVLDRDEVTVWRVAQVWRADSEVLLIARADGQRRRVTFADLSRHYDCIQPF